MAARVSVGNPNAASTAIGGSSRMNCTSPGERSRNSSSSGGSSIARGSATCGARRMPDQLSQAQQAIGHTGQVNSSRLRAMKLSAVAFGAP